MSDERLSDLESRFAWLERHVTEQDRAFVALSDELRRVREELTRLRARAGGGTTAGEVEGPEVERPPHY